MKELEFLKSEIKLAELEIEQLIQTGKKYNIGNRLKTLIQKWENKIEILESEISKLTKHNQTTEINYKGLISTSKKTKQMYLPPGCNLELNHINWRAEK